MTNPFQSIISTNSASESEQVSAAAKATDQDAPIYDFFSGMRIENGAWKADEAKAAKPPINRPPIRGGTYDAGEALQLLNSHFFIGKNNQETGIFRINNDGSATSVPPDQFKLEIQHISVRKLDKVGETKIVAAEKFWREHPQRHERKLVFKPGGTTEPHEFNLWRGFGVEPRKGWQKQRRLVMHIWQVICRCNKAKFKYLMRWLAWAVQNPDKNPGTVIMLQSPEEGTGKSTLGFVMRKIFGPHGALVDDKDRLIGRFNDWLEDKSFIQGDEILFAGDRKSADKLKSMITGDTYQVERKHGSIFQLQNHLHIMMTSNHEHSLAAGVGDRRFAVYGVSNKHACDKSWFDPLYEDLENGGLEEFLYFLKNLKLAAAWHPRQIVKTAEATEQQRMSADSFSQWARACVQADEIVGMGAGPHGVQTTLHLGVLHSAKTLQDAYTGYCKQNSLRPLSIDAFGKKCADDDMFGARKRLPAQNNLSGDGKHRPWGYQIPTGEEWQEKVDARLGIKN